MEELQGTLYFLKKTFKLLNLTQISLMFKKYKKINRLKIFLTIILFFLRKIIPIVYFDNYVGSCTLVNQLQKLPQTASAVVCSLSVSARN